jgi:phosphohistidine phosphatase
VQVFLIRHAEAIEETLAIRDPSRHLTAHGRDQVRHLGDRLRWHDCKPTRIWTSPLVRAVQTAEILATWLHSTVLVEVEPTLAPNQSPRELVTALRALPTDDAVLLVGHEPGLSAVGALLVADPGFVALAKACAVRIVDGQLKWRFAWNADAPE